MLNIVTITEEEYDKLRRDQNMLRALEVMGVDNWEGYSSAIEYLESQQEA